MSKVHAFKCDYCGKIVEYDEIVGVSPLEDMFDVLASFEVVKNPDKADIHFCVAHYADLVTGPASMLYDRRTDEAGYTLKVRELSYSLRKSTVDRYRAFAIARKSKKR
jgi:hypothetical protein